MSEPREDVEKEANSPVTESLNVLNRCSLIGPEVGTTQDLSGEHEPDCEPRSGQGGISDPVDEEWHRPGPRRGPRSLGRYPFLAYLDLYLEAVRPYYASTTFREMSRKLPYLHDVFQRMKTKGLVDTTNPKKIGQREIGALREFMNAQNGLRMRPLSNGSQAKLMQYLDNFLQHCGNGIIPRMRQQRLLRIPTSKTGPLPRFEEEELADLMNRLQEAAGSSRKVLGVFGMAVFCGFAGCRCKESRLANKGDFSQGHWTLMIYHPKGEGSWGVSREALVVRPGRKYVQDFMDLRAVELTRRGIPDGKDVPLVPRFTESNEAVHWPDDILHNAKADVDRGLLDGTDLRFDFRKLRRTYGQMALDRGARIDSVSVALGHASTVTTEKSYARQKTDIAFRDIDLAYSSSSDSIHVDCRKARWSE